MDVLKIIAALLCLTASGTRRFLYHRQEVQRRLQGTLMKRATVSVNTFLQWVTPCETGEAFLREFELMRDAWLSPTVEPDDMLWVLSSLGYIPWADLRKLVLRLIDAKLTLVAHREHAVLPTDASFTIEDGQVYGRYQHLPVVGKIHVSRGDWRPRTPQECMQQQEFIRAAFPDMFTETNKQFITKMKG